MLDRFDELVDGLNHPEGVTWNPVDGLVYAGGEGGEFYSVTLDGDVDAGGLVRRIDAGARGGRARAACTRATRARARSRGSIRRPASSRPTRGGWTAPTWNARTSRRSVPTAPCTSRARGRTAGPRSCGSRPAAATPSAGRTAVPAYPNGCLVTPDGGALVVVEAKAERVVRRADRGRRIGRGARDDRDAARHRRGRDRARRRGQLVGHAVPARRARADRARRRGRNSSSTTTSPRRWTRRPTSRGSGADARPRGRRQRRRAHAVDRRPRRRRPTAALPGGAVMARFTDRDVVVTGAAQGIGRGIVRGVPRRGRAGVRRRRPGRRLDRADPSAGPDRVVTHAVDLADFDAAKAMAQRGDRRGSAACTCS